MVLLIGYVNAILFVLFFVWYLRLQFFTLLFEKRYVLIISLLFGQSIFGITTAIVIAAKGNPWSFVLAIALFLWSLITLGLAVFKILFFRELFITSPKEITRQRTEIGIKHEEIYATTKDGVKISGFHIRNGHSKLIILSHGGSRCKNSFENVGLAQWLSYDYDVISFDTRGHFESHGYWTGDGKTKFDLLAIMDYSKSFGYEKIGLIGRSLGGWTAMLVAAEQGGVDSLVIVSAPLGHIRETPMVRGLVRLKSLLGRLFVRAVHGLRYHDYNDNDTLTPKEIADKLKIPIFLIYTSYDDTIGTTEAEVKDVYNKITAPKRLHIFPETLHLPFPWHLGPIYLFSRTWFLETL